VATPTLTPPVDKTSPIIHLKPNHQFVFAKEWNGKNVVKHTTNSYGFNTSIKFDKNISSNCIIGDSYVEARQINTEKAFHGILSRQGYTVYPIGISGTPLSQYLAFSKWAISNFSCKRIIYVIVDNDFDESILSDNNFPGSHYFNDKSEGELKLIPYQVSAVKWVLRKSALANYLFSNLEISKIFKSKKVKSADEESEKDEQRVKLAISAINYFFQELKSLSLPPDKIIMVLDGDRRAIYNGHDNRKGYNMSAYNHFISKSKENGISIIDLHPVFQADFSKQKKVFSYPFDYHWNEYGHSIVAEQIANSHLLMRTSIH
jgi:hypothetical protein